MLLWGASQPVEITPEHSSRALSMSNDLDRLPSQAHMDVRGRSKPRQSPSNPPRHTHTHTKLRAAPLEGN